MPLVTAVRKVLACEEGLVASKKNIISAIRTTTKQVVAREYRRCGELSRPARELKRVVVSQLQPFQTQNNLANKAAKAAATKQAKAAKRISKHNRTQIKPEYRPVLHNVPMLHRLARKRAAADIPRLAANSALQSGVAVTTGPEAMHSRLAESAGEPYGDEWLLDQLMPSLSEDLVPY